MHNRCSQEESLKMEPVEAKKTDRVTSEQSSQEAPLHVSANEKSARSTFLSRAVIVSAVVMLVAVSTVLAFIRHKSLASSEPRNTPTTGENKQTATKAVFPSGGHVVKLAEWQLQRFQPATVETKAFRIEKTATGKIAFNEDAMTPVFSFYAGRIVWLIAKPGDLVEPGSPLFEIDTPDLMQAESDLLTAQSSLAKAKTTLSLAHRTEDRLHDLYLHKAVAFKEWEQAQSDVKNAESDVRAAEAVLAAVRGRLRVLGKSDAEIARLEEGHGIDRVARVVSPIAGTITARKVGPGQYVRMDNTEPLFMIADLSTMWMLANVYETDVPLIKVGQPVEVRILAYPDDVFQARIDYVEAAGDPITHRVNVRCVVENRDQKLKPEMFATFRIVTTSDVHALAVPLGAVVREGEKTSVWVAQPEGEFVQREVTVGLEQDGYAQILSGLQLGEQVASEGSLFLGNATKS
jgi:membrane fusion protein, heavy metal efflux system